MKQFQVICLKKCVRGPKGKTTTLSPEVGDICTVIAKEEFNKKMYYGFAEFKTGYKYLSTYFATLPDPSEEVAIEQEQEALIYQR